MKKSILFLISLVLISTFLVAHGEDTFAHAEEIIQQKISCDDLTENQLEILGDYYMEQMHPGEQHEIMDEMMGGEGSDSLRQAHINMGLAFYCGEHESMNPSMMNTMMGRNTMYGNMMQGYWPQSNSLTNLFNFLLIVGLILFIIWLIKELTGKKKYKRKNKK